MEAEIQSFQIPDHLNAAVPAEKRLNKTRDDVRMLVLGRRTGHRIHDHFYSLVNYLEAGDVLVLNNSRTIPPVLKGMQNGRVIETRLSRRISNTCWEAFLPGKVVSAGEPIQFPGGIKAIAAGKGSEAPLVRLLFSEGGPALWNMIYKYGEPVRYEYIDSDLPLDTYQTVYASVPGSVEMPSAGRAFTWKLLNGLQKKGVKITFLQLHAGLSYYENNRWPDPGSRPESYHIPAETAQLINEAREKGKRIIAAGTTAVRALETAAARNGTVKAGGGETTLYIHGDYRLKTVDGLLTGFHEPEASHLHMLTAFVKEGRLLKTYREALQKGYLWHEFGDMNLILPEVDQ
ncbi:S-adenosylmethionine:tRNA ribosyltransferase-isomerase [Bacillus marinisedimentorum]|uniref:S-adenosylmethionine:tRNA ribosyltransferase-isomerase n=1 Tax=Bacillus marinisedimentorum TaxID=1821260 RepID=UPI0007DE7D8F|nr:S-adenosylmethionine:tRNA ribosyltransferase-isomerase [Bacillus marinisedimentorum]